MSTKKSLQALSRDWISQAEAARLRGVSRQAITKLIKSQRLEIVEIGGRKLLNRTEILTYIPKPPGRKSGKKGGTK